MALSDYDFKKIGLFLAGFIIFILAVVGSVGTFYYLKKYKTTEQRFREAAVVSQQDVKALLAKVGKLIKLPEDELPTIATVTDLEKLKNQPFFAKAKVGFKVLLYPQNKKAILYDPIENLVIEVGPLIIPTPSPQLAQATGSAISKEINPQQIAGLKTEATPSATVSLNVALLNGSNNPDLLNNLEKEITSKFPYITISSKNNTAKKDYAKSIIIDLTGKNTTATSDIAKNFNLTSSALPSDEKVPVNTDILIILGSD